MRCRTMILAAAVAAVMPRASLAQGDTTGTRLAPVPATLETTLRLPLERQRERIATAVDSLNATLTRFNARCGAVDPRDGAKMTSCQAESSSLDGAIADIEARKVLFNARLKTVVDSTRSAAATPRVVRAEPPAPTADAAVQAEQRAFETNLKGWLDERATAVRAAVVANAQWTKALVAAIRKGSAVEPTYQITRLSALSAGDVILVAPEDPRRSAGDAALGGAIQGADFLVRSASDLASGRAFQSAQRVAPVSHALAFVRSVQGKLLFLDHTSEGSRVLDEREFLRHYGAREMYVARPEAVVDGRVLWTEARLAATQHTSDYGLFGSNVVCSERAGIAVARATGLAFGDRLGPVDITPGDFFDRAGNAGKHFAITRLRITPARE